MKPIIKYQFINKIKTLPFVEEILLFGSRAKDIHSSTADIDLAIKCPKATSRDWEEVLAIIEDADTLLDIDCVRYDKITSEKFKNAIDANHKVLFSRRRVE